MKSRIPCQASQVIIGEALDACARSYRVAIAFQILAVSTLRCVGSPSLPRSIDATVLLSTVVDCLLVGSSPGLEVHVVPLREDPVDPGPSDSMGKLQIPLVVGGAELTFLLLEDAIAKYWRLRSLAVDIADGLE